MIEKSPANHQKLVPNNISIREHFNYLRNNSCGMSDVFNWPTNEANIQDQCINLHQKPSTQIHIQQQEQNTRNAPKQTSTEQEKKAIQHVSFEETNPPRNNKNYPVSETQNLNRNRNIAEQERKRPASSFQRKSRLAKDEEAERAKEEENRQKVLNYIEEVRPYTRSMSNTRFQEYFNKAAPECYGRANINEPIGGIIYGNHLKSFNLNPHVYTNKPEFYQTHTTAINYGKRAKVCEDKKWKRLEKELSKKLGLKDKNETIKEGKEVVYVDVDDNNKEQMLKENHQFQKANREEIHSRELDYKKEKHLEYLDNINEYYAKKQQKIAENLSTLETLDYTGSNLSPEEYEAKLNQQTIYRYHDKNGNVRLAADRHGMTCFVDMNFPENEAAYVEELKNRMPIFPNKVEGEDKYIDSIRKGNCKKGHEEVYPSHYLLRNCEEPEVIKMLSNKSGVKVQGTKLENERKIVQNETRRMNSPEGYQGNKSFVSTNYSQTKQPVQQGQNRQIFDRTDFVNEESSKNKQTVQKVPIDQFRSNKSEIINSAWENPQIGGMLSKTVQNCCIKEHLPHNELDPHCYKNASGKVGRIPYAG